MFSNFHYPAPQPISKPALTSPFFMFLSDQQKANKAQNPDIKLLDLATNAIKEWDSVVSIRDEYTAKFLQESENIDSPIILPNVQESPVAVSQSKREPTLYYNAEGKLMPPKRPLSAFFLYKEDCFARIKRENPTLKVTELTKIIAQNWGQIDSPTKAYYETKSQEAKEFYEKEIKLYESASGDSFQPLQGFKSTLFSRR